MEVKGNSAMLEMKRPISAIFRRQAHTDNKHAQSHKVDILFPFHILNLVRGLVKPSFGALFVLRDIPFHGNVQR